jgi:hypothetical protein
VELDIWRERDGTDRSNRWCSSTKRPNAYCFHDPKRHRSSGPSPCVRCYRCDFLDANSLIRIAAIGEIIPNKYRGYAQAAFEIMVTPYLLPSALYSNLLVKEPRLSWRTIFVIGIGLNVITLIALWFWYTPITAKHLDPRFRRQRLAKIDWIGIAILAAATTLFLVACSWGGLMYPWDSAATTAPLVIGICGFVAFALWEWKGARYPFMDHELFRGEAAGGFPLLLIVSFVSGMTM